MNYAIFYKSMTIKLSNGKVIPMIELGDNNCYEWNSKKRARSWYGMFDKQMRVALTIKEYEELVEDFTKRNHLSYDCIYGNGNLTPKKCYNFFLKKGLANSISFNKAVEIGFSLHVDNYMDKIHFNCYPKTENEMYEFIDKYKDKGHLYCSFVSWLANPVYDAIDTIRKSHNKGKYMLCGTKRGDNRIKYVGVLNDVPVLVDDMKQAIHFEKPSKISAFSEYFDMEQMQWLIRY